VVAAVEGVEPLSEADEPMEQDGRVRRAEAACAERGLKLTPARRRALEILVAAGRPLGAYDVLAQLQRDGVAQQPPAAYRALDFLTAHGFAHKLRTRNAYVACEHPGAAHEAAFVVCRRCGRVVETALAPERATLARLVAGSGFTVEQVVVEAQGLCPDCRTAGTA